MNLHFSASVLPSDGVIPLKEGRLPPSGLDCQPFGEATFLELMNIFSRNALALKEVGAEYLSLNDMISLAELRAAILGTWHAGLPVLVCIAVDEDGKAFLESDALAVLLTAQGMGVGAFALRNAKGTRTAAKSQLERLAPFAKIPLLLHEENGGFTEYSGKTTAVLLDDEFVLCNDNEVFYLCTDYELSPPIECELDMTDSIKEAEDDGCDVLLVHLATNDDAYAFSQNAHMASLPVCFIAENEEALEAALIYYNGRPIIDKRSEVAPQQLKTLAEGYGAIL
ncbi:MAG: hypothetical protein RSA45_00990 [Hydrogenoanaerobacterium sp.]